MNWFHLVNLLNWSLLIKPLIISPTLLLTTLKSSLVSRCCFHRWNPWCSYRCKQRNHLRLPNERGNWRISEGFRRPFRSSNRRKQEWCSFRRLWCGRTLGNKDFQANPIRLPLFRWSDFQKWFLQWGCCLFRVIEYASFFCCPQITLIVFYREIQKKLLRNLRYQRELNLVCYKSILVFDKPQIQIKIRLVCGINIEICFLLNGKMHFHTFRFQMGRPMKLFLFTI